MFSFSNFSNCSSALVIVLIACLMAIFLPAVANNIGYEEFPQRYFSLKATTYQVVLDVEDPCFEILSGNWQLSYSGSYLNYYYFTINGPGTGNGRARWIAEGLPVGSYLIEFWANYGDYAADARYQVICADGISSVTVNMNYIPAGWHPLGTFNINRVCVVNISDFWTGSGTQLSVDALRFTLLSPLPAPPASVVPPHIGICIDDCGAVDPTQPSQPIYKMLRLPFKMTFAVLPYRSYTAQTAEEIHRHGGEVILHQPMAAITVPNPGAGGITANMTLEEVRNTVTTNLGLIPYVVGMNNHMGSLITQQRDKMQVCMEVLKSLGYYFFDSRTITTSVAYDVAKEQGLLTGERDLFIDGNNTEQAKELIRSLALRALYAPNLPHLAIGHVRSSTADALVEMVPELEALGVEVWQISRCLAQVIECDFTPAGCSFVASGNWTATSDDCYSKQLYDGTAMTVLNPAATRDDIAFFIPNLPVEGLYDIYAIWNGSLNVSPGKQPGASQIVALVYHTNGMSEILLDQSQVQNTWVYLGRYHCSAGSASHIELVDVSCTIPGTVFYADAVKYVYAGQPEEVDVKNWMLF